MQQSYRYMRQRSYREQKKPTCDSVVRAPIAPQATRSAVYCGVIVSSIKISQDFLKLNLETMYLKIHSLRGGQVLQFREAAHVQVEGLC